MPKYLDLTGLEYNNNKLIAKLGGLKSLDNNIIMGSKDFSGSKVVFPGKNYGDYSSPGHLSEKINGLDTFQVEGDTIEASTTAYIQVPLRFPEYLKTGDVISVNFYACSYEVENMSNPNLIIGTWVNNNISDQICTPTQTVSADNTLVLGTTYKYLQANITLTGDATSSHKLFLRLTSHNAAQLGGYILKISNITATVSQVQVPYDINSNDLYDIIEKRKTSLEQEIDKTIYNGKLVNTIASVASGGNLYLKGNYFNKLTAAAPDKFTIRFQNPGKGEPEYILDFTTGSTAPTITMPAGVVWLNGTIPTLEASTHYQLSVLNKCAIIAKF